MNRRITIPVEVPRMQFVHTADLILRDNEGKTFDEDATVIVGNTIAAELRIRHTRAWDSEQTIRPATSEHTASPRVPDDLVDFYYEIQAKPELWLIGGRRKAQFSARVHLTIDSWMSITALTVGRRTTNTSFLSCSSPYDLVIYSYLM